MFLIRPSERYKTTYLEGLKEFQREGRNLKLDASALEKDFSAFVAMLRSREGSSGLPNGKVPESVFWLIDNSEFIGRITIRHGLNEYLYRYGGHIGYEIRPARRRQGYGKQLLELGLQEARRLGLDSVLVTCDSDNIASRGIIESNGGIFENEVPFQEDTPLIRRYWIKLDR